MPDSSDFGPYGIFILVFGFNIAIIVIAMIFSYRRRQAMQRGWDDLAMRTGLAFNKGNWLTSPEVKGEYRRRGLILNTFARGSSRSRTTYTRIELAVENATGSRLRIATASVVADFFGMLFNAEDVKTGNPEFDSRFRIKSSPPDFAVVALDDSMTRMGIMDIAERFEIQLQGATLSYIERGTISDPERLKKLFDTLSDLADRVEGKKHGAF